MFSNDPGWFSARSSNELVRLAGVRLRRLRRSDAPSVRAELDRLSPRSRVERFGHAALRPELELAWLCELDGERHLALCAYLAPSATPLGLARYVKTGPATAEVAVTIVDAWQGHGVGGLLLGELCSEARAHGVNTLTAAIRLENRRALRLFRSIGARRTAAFGGDLLYYAAALGQP